MKELTYIFIKVPGTQEAAVYNSELYNQEDFKQLDELDKEQCFVVGMLSTTKQSELVNILLQFLGRQMIKMFLGVRGHRIEINFMFPIFSWDCKMSLRFFFSEKKFSFSKKSLLKLLKLISPMLARATLHSQFMVVVGNAQAALF